MIADARHVTSALRRGDVLSHCLTTGWLLTRAGEDVCPKLVAEMIGQRRLVPAEDGLPGLGHSQTWHLRPCAQSAKPERGRLELAWPKQAGSWVWPRPVARPLPTPPGPYRYAWHTRLPGRYGQLCRVICRGSLNSALLEFDDGYRVITNRAALRKMPPGARST